MRRLFYPFFSLLVIASLLVTTSCGTDEEVTPARPTFTISGIDDDATTTVLPGQEVAFNLLINAPGGFNTLYINKTGGTAMDEIVVSRGATVEQAFTYNFSYTPTAEEAGQNLVFDFRAVDENGLDNTFSYTIVVTEPALIVYEDELLYAPLEAGTSQTWYSVSTGEAYTSNQINSSTETISNRIDFGYFFGTNELGATLASPRNYPISTAGQATWTVKNDTKLKKTTLPASAFFEASTRATIQDAFNNATFGANEGRATNLKVGDVVAFMTDPSKPGGSKMGLAHVSEIVTGTGSTGMIRLNVKVIP